MSLPRFAARTLLAGYFITDGVKAVTSPHSRAPEVEPMVAKAIPFLKSIAPAGVASVLPESPANVVRLAGVLQVAGGLALATGIARRPGAALLAASMVPHVIASSPIGGANSESGHFAKNLALLGGTLLASGDTEGKPGLSWRVNHGAEQLSRKAEKARGKLEKDAAKAAKKARKTLQSA